MNPQKPPKGENKATSVSDELLSAIAPELKEFEAIYNELMKQKIINNNHQDQVNSESEYFSTNFKQPFHTDPPKPPKRKYKVSFSTDELLTTTAPTLEELETLYNEFTNKSPINNNWDQINSESNASSAADQIKDIMNALEKCVNSTDDLLKNAKIKDQQAFDEDINIRLDEEILRIEKAQLNKKLNNLLNQLKTPNLKIK